MPKAKPQPAQPEQPDQAYDPDAIFQPNSPINPTVVDEAVRTLMRAMPLADQTEPRSWAYRRMFSAMRALAALHPRDEIELMLGIQALSAYHAAAACWRIGMNSRQPSGDSTRHIASAASAARTFDSLLKAIERRQAKPLAIPQGRPEPRAWPEQNPAAVIAELEARCRHGEDDPDPESRSSSHQDPEIVWTPQAVAAAEETAERERQQAENEGLDIANTEGIRPDGSIIMPEYPTPQQDAYIARRVGLQYKREYAENLRNGINKHPEIRPLRTGDIVP